MGTETSTDDADKETTQSLRAAIVDTQGVIRSYDTKAQVVGAFVGIAVAATKLADPTVTSCILRATATAAVGLAAVTFILLGFVLYPRSRTRIRLGNYSPQNIFFPHETDNGSNDVAKFAARARQTDWVSELTYELVKLVAIRTSKRAWLAPAMISALCAILACLAVAAISSWGVR